jgi:restriction system protein
MAKRGFFAEMQRAAAQADRERQRSNAAAYRAQQQAQREADRAARESERYAAQSARLDAKAQAAAEKEAKRLYIEAREAEVASMNEDLKVSLDDIDNILNATLDVDDYVELKELRQVAEHPEFASDHGTPIPKSAPLTAPLEPVFAEPDAPKGLSGLFGKKKHQEAVDTARAEFDTVHAAWQAEASAIPMRQLGQLAAHKEAEAAREARLAADRATYDAACVEREADVARRNTELDLLIDGVAAGRSESVEEYVGIVFGNTMYPEGAEPGYDYRYDAAGKELTITLELPAPAQLPTVAQYKYAKAADEISEKAQTAKEQKDRYNAFVANVALRTLHEIFEADRQGNIASISLTGGVTGISAATGQTGFTPLIACAVARDTFESIALANIVPAETLKHFNAIVSKNAHGLVPIDTGRGVRAH